MVFNDSMDSMVGLDSMKHGRTNDVSLVARARLEEVLQVHGKDDLADLPNSVKDKASPWSNDASGMPMDRFEFEYGRLELDFRMRMAETEFFEGLQFTSVPASGACTLSYRKADGSYAPLVIVKRPKFDTFAAQVDAVMADAQQRNTFFSTMLIEQDPPEPLWCSMLPLDPVRTPETIHLLRVALSVASAVVQRFKIALACPRPYEYSSDLQPMLTTPGHASFPSGHSTQAFMCAHLIAEHAVGRAPLLKERLQAQAVRIAKNRQVAGIHFPADSACGRVLGQTLAEYFMARLFGKAFATRGFDGEVFYKDDPLKDPDLKTVFTDFALGAGAAPAAPDPCSVLTQMGKAAAKEWRTKNAVEFPPPANPPGQP